MRDPYWRRCRVVSVTDGDTLRVTVDLGYRNYADHSVRLLGVDTPELRGESREAGLEAKRFVEEWVGAHALGKWPFCIRSEKADSFGRYLGIIECANCDSTLNEELVVSGNAVLRA